MTIIVAAEASDQAASGAISSEFYKRQNWNPLDDIKTQVTEPTPEIFL